MNSARSFRYRQLRHGRNKGEPLPVLSEAGATRLLAEMALDGPPGPCPECSAPEPGNHGWCKLCAAIIADENAVADAALEASREWYEEDRGHDG
jgi:hypothetical protein